MRVHAVSILLSGIIELQRVMLARQDGARVVASARSSLRRADFSELAMTSLVAQGVDLQQARLVVLAVERFTVGFVLESQAAPAAEVARLLSPEDLAVRFPNAKRAITEYFEAGRTAEFLGLPGLQ